METTTGAENSAAQQASQAWHAAVKLRKHLLKQLDTLKTAEKSGFDPAKFDAVESTLEKFRFAFVHTVFLDFEYASAQHVEHVLWQLHTTIKVEYRKLLDRLATSQAVEKRKAGKKYTDFLRTAQQFYRGYVQRLYARYNVPGLKRVALGMELDSAAAQDQLSDVSGNLSAKVLSSCYSTLVHMGDLARYRSQARNKASGLETALVYYGLAHDLKPESALALHQMAIVNLDQKNHLDIVYHFYRAWASPDPHPNAKSNLASEFKLMRLPTASAPAPQNTQSPGDALVKWFVRLHALLYKGEPSDKHEELEGEVIHRVGIAAQDGTMSSNLLKMSLINIAAYYIATRKLSEQQSDTAIFSCRYMLRFNVRFLLTVCEILRSRLGKSATRNAEESNEKITSSPCLEVNDLLPVLRIYAAWLAACRIEVFGASDVLATVTPAMTQSLAQNFTLLCAEAHKQEHLRSCNYLLPEDLDIRGFVPLDADHVPESCRAWCEDDGSSKPYPPKSDGKDDSLQEAIGRILDILRCAYFLAEDAAVPMAYRVADGGLLFEYQPEVTHITTGRLQAENSNGTLQPTSLGPRTAVQPDQEFPPQGDHMTRAAGNELPSHLPEDPRQDTGTDIDADDQVDDTVINMLAPFLKPPTPQQESTPVAQHTGIDNGAHTPFAPEITSNGSMPSQTRKLEALPWSWMYTPTPQKEHHMASAAGKEAFSNARQHGNPTRSSVPEPTENTDDPFLSSASGHPGNPVGNGPYAGRLGEGVSYRDSFRQAFASATQNHGPQTSMFTDWGHHQQHHQHPQPSYVSSAYADPMTGSSWTQLTPDGPRYYENAPMPSDASAFSHMSSLYQGTPETGANYGFQSYGTEPLGPNQGGAAQAYNTTQTQQHWTAGAGSRAGGIASEQDDTARAYTAFHGK